MYIESCPSFELSDNDLIIPITYASRHNSVCSFNKARIVSTIREASTGLLVCPIIFKAQIRSVETAGCQVAQVIDTQLSEKKFAFQIPFVRLTLYTLCLGAGQPDMLSYNEVCVK